MIATKNLLLLQKPREGRTQRRQLAAKRFVALFALLQQFPKQRVIHDATIIIDSRKKSIARAREHNNDFHVVAQPLSPIRHSWSEFACKRLLRLLGSGRLVTLTTFGGVEVYTADHHRQRHGIDFDGQRSGIPAAWQLKTTAFQSLDLDITIPSILRRYRNSRGNASRERKVFTLQ